MPRRSDMLLREKIQGFSVNSVNFRLVISISTYGVICVRDEWKKKSESGTTNRASTDSTNKRPRARHTGGSLGFDEHRVRLKNKTGQEPSFREVFLQTHLTKESKARLENGELEVNNMEGMDFCITRAREIYGRTTRLYGIGSIDINYLMIGKPSASFGVGPSQDKILALENQIQDSEARFEEFEARLQAQREADRKAFEDALKAQREAMQKDFEELIKSGGPSN